MFTSRKMIFIIAAGVFLGISLYTLPGEILRWVQQRREEAEKAEKDRKWQEQNAKWEQERNDQAKLRDIQFNEEMEAREKEREEERIRTFWRKLFSRVESNLRIGTFKMSSFQELHNAILADIQYQQEVAKVGQQQVLLDEREALQDKVASLKSEVQRYQRWQQEDTARKDTPFHFDRSDYYERKIKTTKSLWDLYYREWQFVNRQLKNMR